ncbi:MAG: helix-turn-helix domain-containing protein [Paralcaligenes sp.]
MQALQELGFTEYEARAYTALIDAGELSGYELAKESGIPRANVYAVLDKLLQRGAAQRLQHSGGQRYAAISPDQLLRGIETSQKRALLAAGQALAQRSGRSEPVAVFNLRDGELLAKAQQLIDACENTLLIAIQPQEASLLAEPLRMARERGVAIITLCLQACEHECGGCQGEIHRYQLAPVDGMRWLVLVADGGTTLIGQLGATAIDGMVTEHRLVRELAAAYILQSLALAALGGDLAARGDGQLSEEVQHLLKQLYPCGIPTCIQSVDGAASL